MNTATKTGLDATKTASKKVFHKTAEETGKLTGNKIANKIAKPILLSEANSRNVEEIVIQPEKRQGILNDLRQIL